MPVTRPARRHRVWVVPVTALVAAWLTALGAAAPTQLSAGSAEVGGGADVGETGLAFWQWEATQLWLIPATVPPALSTSVVTPTRLPAAGTSYVVNAAAAGANAVRWEFHEGAGAPTSNEIELRLLVGLSGVTSSLRVYIETQTTAPRATLTFYLFWDAGGSTPSALTLESMQVDALLCASVGTCP
jgi:hypothetical protein